MIPTHDEDRYHVLNMPRGVIVAKDVTLLEAATLTGMKQKDIRERCSESFVGNHVSSRFPAIYKMPWVVIRAGVDGSIVLTVDDLIRRINYGREWEERLHNREVARFRKRVAAGRRILGDK